jgi:hypothetical protein
MNISYSLNWKLDVWPDVFKDEAIQYMGEDSSYATASNQSLQWHHSFALGFFGFHYIRAAKEDDFVLKQESLQILRELVTACNLDGVVMKGLDMRRGRGLRSDMFRKIALALGDSLGQQAQQMVELGFWLAAVYAGLVEALRDDNHSYMKECLVILENGFASFQPSDMPAPLRNSLVDIKKLLRSSKKRTIAYECFNKIESMLKHVLLSKTAWQLS